MDPVKIGLLGLGTVGSGTVRVLQENGEEIARRIGRELVITHACARDLNKKRDCDLSNIELTTDPFSIIKNPNIDIVVEVIGDIEMARKVILDAIDNGKQVITANKALVAVHGNEIFARGQEKGVSVMFEAAVAGGIPIIKTIREGMGGNRIQWLAGIINGTANFLLTAMRDTGIAFDDALKQAQDAGYAEADPSFDVDGIDAAHKLTILASIAFGIPLQFEKVYVEGIRHVSTVDVQNAQALGYSLKHLGIARRIEGEGLALHVHPAMIPKKHLLARVDGVMNAVYLMSDAVGPTLYYGAGAGGSATASAITADIVDVARSLSADQNVRVPYLAFQPHALSEESILPMDKITSSYYLRLDAVDKLGTLANLTQILAASRISIETIIQKHEQAAGGVVPIVLVTHPATERQMNQALADIESLNSIQGPIQRIRIERL